MREKRLGFSACVALGLALFALPIQAADITVFAAASLAESLKEIANHYAKQSDDKIVFNFAASSLLARQIVEGAPADIFFSADETQMNVVAAHKLVAPDTRTNLLGNALAVVVATNAGPRIERASDLARPEVRRIALGDPEAVPAGVYARQYLQKLELWDTVKSKVVPTESVRAALAAVEAGNADAAIVYATDTQVSRRVRVAVAVPVADGPPIRYPVALLRESRSSEAARRFLAYLRSPAAMEVFRRYQFIVLPAG